MSRTEVTSELYRRYEERFGNDPYDLKYPIVITYRPGIVVSLQKIRLTASRCLEFFVVTNGSKEGLWSRFYGGVDLEKEYGDQALFSMLDVHITAYTEFKIVPNKN